MTQDENDRQPKKRRRTRRVSQAEVAAFLRQYGRKAQRGHEPNDRAYSRTVEKKIRRMKAEELDRLIRGEDSE
jgi:hypothetical protein